MEKKPIALNVDVASVNTGIHRGLGVKIKEDVLWLMLVHSFNHCLELAINDTVSAIFFDEIEVMLRKIYCLYKISPKQLRELKEFGNIFEKAMQRPSKSTGTC